MKSLMPSLDESKERFVYNIRPVDGAECKLLIDGDPNTIGITNPVGEEFTFIVGESDSDINDDIENEVVKLKAGQTCKISEQNDIKLTLNSFQNRPPIGNLTDKEKLDIAKHHKSKGVELFKQGLFEFAFRRFSKAMKFLILLLPYKESSSSFSSEINELRVHCYSNIALCQLKFANFEFVKKNCDKALAIDPSHVKSWYRKADACYRQQHWIDSEKASKQGLQIEPHNKSLLQLLEKAQHELSKIS